MTTRICVKGLPKSADDAKLRAHFAARFGDAAITDARVVRTRDGASRCFGFVGFKTADNAADAVSWFHRSFFGAARLAVEPAEPVGSAGLARPWSKYSKAKEAEGGGGRGSGGAGAPARADAPARGAAAPALPDDPRFAEFVALHKRRADVPLWANDDAGAVGVAAVAPDAGRRKAPPRQAAPSDDDDGDAAADATAASDDEYEDMTGGVEATDEEEPSEDEGTPPPPDAAVADAAVSDADYLKSRTVAAFSSDDDEEEEEEEEEEDEENSDGPPSAAPVATPAAPAPRRPSPDGGPIIVDATADADLAAPAGALGGGGGRARDSDDDAPAPLTDRLFLRNLPYTATDADVADALSPYGAVRDVRIVTDRLSRQSRGLAIATMDSVDAAAAARAALDGTIFQGRLLHVLPGEPAPQDKGIGAAGADASTSFKDAREAARRAGAGGADDRAAWSTLFIRADTVAAAAAAHFGVAKADLLARDADDAAVRLALGEAHVLATTKRALAEAGVDVGALAAAAAAPRKRGRGAAADAGPPRSTTTLLVKNLPYATTESDLETLLTPHGALARLVLPPTRALALAEFSDPRAAAAALKAVAYRRLHSVPLYLEWAPAGVWAAPPAPGAGVAKTQPPAAAAAEPARAAAVAAVAARAADDADAAAAAGTSLFVKNLSFATDDAELAAHFRSVAAAAGLPSSSVRSARVARRPRPPGAPPGAPAPSAGYGFVEAGTEEAAAALARAASGTRVGGHALVVQRASRRGAASSAAPPPGAGGDARTKLIVRNVAFQASRADVVALFSPFGAVKSARLPKKASLDGAHRGYAFVDFASHEEAVAAAAGVGGAHLYGRRLAVEWADDDTEGGVDALTAKAAAGFKKQKR